MKKKTENKIEEKKEFKEDVDNFLKEKIPERGTRVLAKFLENNLKYYDDSYIKKCILLFCSNAINALNFKDEMIERERNQRLLQNLGKIKKRILKEINLFDPEDKETWFRVKGALIEFVDQITHESLFNDPIYFAGAIEDDERLLLANRLQLLIHNLYDDIEWRKVFTYEDNNKKLWGVNKDGITFKMLDDISKEK